MTVQEEMIRLDTNWYARISGYSQRNRDDAHWNAEYANIAVNAGKPLTRRA